MKKKNIKQFYKFISLLLVMTLLYPFLFNAVALDVSAADGISKAEFSEQKENTNTEVMPLISADEVPNFISQAQVEENGHISRIFDEEAPNTLVYLNRDGTKTKYIMDHPVKYVDENGNTEFIDLSLTETSTAFKTTANDIGLSMSKDYTKGITLTYNDYAVSLVAIPDNKTNALGGISTAPIVTATENNDSVAYNDVFGAGIDIKYSPLHNGVKEDIILHSYTGVNAFDFLLNTGGLKAYFEKNSYYLAEAADSDMRIDLGDVIVYDANRKMSKGALTVTPIKANQLYQVTVSADQAFLADPTTVYPVQIDPSLEISDSVNYANAIIDSPVYSGKPTINMGTALYNPIGYLDSAYQTGRTAVKLPGLANDSTYQSLNENGIISASFHIKDSSGTAAKAVNIYALTSNSTWTETSLTWNTVGDTSPAVQATANVGGGAWSSFNITNLVKDWKTETYDINCGFILQSVNESLAGNFFSSEAAEMNYPYLTLVYANTGSGGGTSFSNALTIFMSSNSLVNTVISGEKRYYKFIPTESAEYVLYSSKVSGDPKIWVYDANLQQIGSNDDGAGELNFRMPVSMMKNNTYYLELGHNGTKSGEYRFFILKDAGLVDGNYYIQNLKSLQYLDIHGPVAQELLHQWQFSYGDQAKWEFTCQADGYYTIRSMYGDRKYAGVSSSAVGTNNAILASQITNETKWKLLVDYRGQLILEPKSALGKALNSPNSLVGSELQLATIIYQNATVGMHWRPLEFKYTLNVRHYYDNGLVVRFSEDMEDIADYQRVCSNIFLEIFGLSTTINSIQKYDSCADECTGLPVSIEDTTEACDCLMPIHKTKAGFEANLILQFGSGDSTNVQIGWSGHDIDDNRSYSEPVTHTVLMLPLNPTRARRIFTLTHETSHQIGAPDHYCYTKIFGASCINPNCWECKKNTTPPACLMTEEDLGLENKLASGNLTGVYCEDCLSYTDNNGIFAHLEDHH